MLNGLAGPRSLAVAAIAQTDEVRQARMRRRGSSLVLLAALVLALALASTASAYEQVPEPGAVNAKASWRAFGQTFANDPNLQSLTDEWDINAGTDGHATTGYRYEPFAPRLGVFDCPATGCVGYDLRALGAADVRQGLLKAYASGSMYIGNPSPDGGLAGLLMMNGGAVINDTITLSQPATVILRGRLTGAMDASNSHTTSQGNDPEAYIRFEALFRGTEHTCGDSIHPGWWCFPVIGGLERRSLQARTVAVDGLTCETCPAPELVDQSFSVAVELPAGTSNFNALLSAKMDYQVFGEPNQLVTKRAVLDFAESLKFVIEVPNGVEATSGSGLLPIVGGTASDPPPPDRTPEHQIAELSQTIQAMAIPSGIKQSLTQKLQTALSSYNSGAKQTACHQLDSFIREVGAQSGKKIPTADANKLIADAEQIKQSIGCEPPS